MPETSKKWDVAAERDLCMAMIVGNQDSERIKYNWPAVHAFMTTLGYNFTKDAISQHYTKTILKDFRARNGNMPATPKKSESEAETASTPKSKKRAPKATKAAVARKPKAALKEEEEDDDDLGNVDDGLEESPTKKVKIEQLQLQGQDQNEEQEQEQDQKGQQLKPGKRMA